ncbi:MAG: tetratricopeptide repeat protein [Elusimicrobia bacterium]|nr:tetratricopeptide repeat protein [Elusimicrobiota bacterium]
MARPAALLPLLLTVLAGRPAAAQETDHERLSLVGWLKSCSVAVEYYGFPVLGSAIATDPIMVRIGTLSIGGPDSQMAKTWLIEEEGRKIWRPEQAAKTIDNLRKAGYVLAGSSEPVTVAAAGFADIDEVILTTKAFSARSPGGWPGKEFVFHRIYYSPLNNCALFVYRWTGAREKDFFQFILVETRNPRARVLRADARLSLSRRLFDAGDLAGALGEAGLAAALSPDSPEARYRHAALLALSGHHEAALDELAEAVKRDKKLKERARKDLDLENLRKDKRFRRLIHD